MGFYTKPSKDLLLEAINRDNHLTANPLTWNQIAAGYPEVVGSLGENRNTRVTVYALNRQGYSGSVSLLYDRIDLPSLFRKVVPTVFGDPVNHLSDALPKLNDKYGLSLTTDDIVDQDVLTLGEDWTVTVATKPSSLAWQGGFTFRYAKRIPKLTDVVTDVDLNAIIAPITVSTKPRAEYLTYGYDWTEMKTLLDTTWEKGRVLSATDIDALNEVVALNFVNKNATTVTGLEVGLLGAVYNGSETVTPGSLYDIGYLRAATITLATDSNYVGNLILHYNPL